MARVTKLEGEVVTVLCHDCLCCVNGDSHCAICHTTKPVAELCGCFDKECVGKLQDYVARERIRIRKVKLDRKAREIAA